MESPTAFAIASFIAMTDSPAASNFSLIIRMVSRLLAALGAEPAAIQSCIIRVLMMKGDIMASVTTSAATFGISNAAVEGKEGRRNINGILLHCTINARPARSFAWLSDLSSASDLEGTAKGDAWAAHATDAC
ncbi:hypothetical protein [Aurantimonas sp. VKM B-3413]|uniref:hypothetical protein n=1 Tax=Aurantimonas sp. VKM B-3413 TaxID=2779401 RepID=UPI001E47AF14|nr:hypothetical protein [Aurantimonas sp. VKM B-3413]MCB8837653.1 hypothetical protein [Aurantimonas sp. VKM B-3413]